MKSLLLFSKAYCSLGFTNQTVTSITIAFAQFFVSDFKFLLYVEMPVNMLMLCITTILFCVMDIERAQ